MCISSQFLLVGLCGVLNFRFFLLLISYTADARRATPARRSCAVRCWCVVLQVGRGRGSGERRITDTVCVCVTVSTAPSRIGRELILSERTESRPHSRPLRAGSVTYLCVHAHL